MNDKFDRIDSKLDQVNEQLGEINQTLIRQEENLRQHMYRTELLEESVQLLKHEFSPIKDTVSQAKGALKLLGLLGIIAGIASAIVRIVYSN